MKNADHDTIAEDEIIVFFFVSSKTLSNFLFSTKLADIIQETTCKWRWTLFSFFSYGIP